MSRELITLVKRILSQSPELEKLYPYFSEYINADTTYYYKKLCDMSPEFSTLFLDTQAEIIAFCFKCGLKMVNKLINNVDDIEKLKEEIKEVSPFIN